jgi:putative component of membrane protein insertase Oxa1/YidC/SpoIIIJ protein YidD/TM2 domain-containing membrane protein YozV
MVHYIKWFHYHIISKFIILLLLIVPLKTRAQEEISKINVVETTKDSSLNQDFKTFKSLDASNKVNNLNISKSNRSPILSSAMSAVLPGSGQIYCGRIKEGINSFVLLGGLTALCFVAPEIIVLTAPALGRYYWGGVYHSYLYAKDSNNHQVSIDTSLISKLNPLLKIPYITYKKYFSSQDLDVCVFEPSCSNYMIKTIKEKGLITGFLDGTDRLLRCHPFASTKNYKFNWGTQKYEDDILKPYLPIQKQKNPYLSALMSSIIPGSGKIYTNHIFDGLYSFLVCSTFSYLTYNSFKKHGFNYSTVIYGTLSISFYSANIYGSYKSAGTNLKY